jgi:type I restriction enzyme, R subunit
MKFTEEKLELAFIQLLEEQEIPHVSGKTIQRKSNEVLLVDDIRQYLFSQYAVDNITESEIEQIIRRIESFPASDLYDSNKTFMKLLCNGFELKREDPNEKDIWIYLIDYSKTNNNNYKMVNQMEIDIFHLRIPDGILYINGLPLVVFEFKSAIRENATVFDAYEQLTNRYQRDIPNLFLYNAFCVISDGVNSKAGSFFSAYDFYYAWRKITGEEASVDGINAMYSLIQGMFNHNRLRDIIRNFIYIPDASKKDEKILCRYPQYYAANKLLTNIKAHQRPEGDGKGGTYFGATGCGKSYTMLFLARLLMKSVDFSSPTIVVITDRTDLDEQLSKTFTNAKEYIGDNTIISVESRNHLRELLQDRSSGGVFLTTIHKFNEDIETLTERTNVICISDEAHRSQINLDQKVTVSDKGVKKTFGFAKYLHDSLPNATFVGFTGTPIDATLDVFGPIIDSYTMTESVTDEITKRIVYEGRAAKVLLDNAKLQEIEAYYASCAEECSNEHQIEESKKAVTKMNAIIGDPDRLKAIAKDFVTHYENRVNEGSSVRGKAMFVCSSRPIAYELYKEIIVIRPAWAKVLTCEEGSELTEKEQQEIMPMERVKMIMTRNKDDKKEMYNILGTKEDRKELDRQFKSDKSNFKIAIVVDMWLTGFDVPFLDTIYIDKPIQQHNLIQTISRVNRNFPGKEKGLVVDYIGIKSQMNKALAKYSKGDSSNFEDIEKSITAVKDQLDLLGRVFHTFDKTNYFKGNPVEQLDCLNNAVEYVQLTSDLENRFMNLVKRLKAAYDICCGSEAISDEERDLIHFYLAIRSILVKLTKHDAPDTAQMNARVKEMIKEAIQSEGVSEIFKLGDDKETEIDIFDADYLAKIERIKLPNTKIKLLQQLLAKAIDSFKKVNKAKGVDFSKKMQTLVENYNERKADVLQSEVLEEFTDEIIELYHELRKEKDSFSEMGIDFEEKAFYDILKMIAHKFDFDYPEDKLIMLSKEVKLVVDDKAKYTDWNHRADIKAELKMDLIKLLAKNGYPPITKDEVFKEILEQAENFKKFS